MLLSFHWEMRRHPLRSPSSSAPAAPHTLATLQSFFSTLAIPLCAHKALHDADVVRALYVLLVPGATPADPVERYLEREGGLGCGVCGAGVRVYKRREGEGRTVRVDVRRGLGRGEGEEDGGEGWRRICGG